MESRFKNRKRGGGISTVETSRRDTISFSNEIYP